MSIPQQPSENGLKMLGLNEEIRTFLATPIYEPFNAGVDTLEARVTKIQEFLRRCPAYEGRETIAQLMHEMNAADRYIRISEFGELEVGREIVAAIRADEKQMAAIVKKNADIESEIAALVATRRENDRAWSEKQQKSRELMWEVERLMKENEAEESKRARMANDQAECQGR